ncbi:MAG: hypothetical protein QGH74_01445 [Candidatus Brocadiia bacterium]|nr:hypothetical protein [Candidatus Brocadiia bacterium]
MRIVWTRLRGRTGQGLVEYALILVLVVLLVIIALSTIGTKTQNTLEEGTNAFP